MTFENIIGQDKAVSFLKETIRRDTFSNAYLFSGPEGVGKYLTAAAFANAISKGYDIERILPEHNSKTIGIERVREMVINAGRMPLEGNYKVFIIKEAERMTEEAANCLLKTLEEPPLNTIFILTTSNVLRILPTIVSRCQIIRFSSLKIDDALKILLQNGYGKDEGCIIARFTSGRPGQAIDLLKEEWHQKRQEVIERFVTSAPIASGQIKKDVQGRDDIFKERDELLKAIEILQSILRDIMLWKLCHNCEDMVVHLDRVDLIKNIAHVSTLDSLLDTMKSLNRLEYYLHQNGNPKLALAMIEIAMDILKKSVIFS